MHPSHGARMLLRRGRRASVLPARYKALVIRVAHLTKRYGAHLAVDDVSFEVGKSQVVGLLGPNGAGKTTLLRTLAGVLGPTAGEITIAGHDAVRDSFEARRHIGYMTEAAALYVEMRVVEYLLFRAELKRVPRGTRTAHVDEAMARAGVIDVANKRIAHLSKGYRQRVGIADAIVAKPPIVILDEPTAGLDPNQIRQARALVRELGQSHTVIVSTHILSEVEACATHVLLLHRGKLVAQGSMGAIASLRHERGATVDFVVRGRAERAQAAAASVPGVEAASAHALHETGDGTGDETALVALRVTFGPGTDASTRATATEDIVTALVAGGLRIREIQPAAGSLEDIFAQLTAPDPASAAA
jgi:ABC-2 type transport system ATP-binding protein